MNAHPLDAKLDGVLGGKTATALGKAFGMVTVGDLLAHYPRRYAHRGELTQVADVPLDENVTIVAEVLDVRTRPMRAKRGSILEVRITDGSSGTMTLTFFNQAWRERDLTPGSRGIFAGKASRYRGTLQLAHPDYELFDERSSDIEAEAWAKQPIPIYPATGSLSSWQIAKMVALALPFATDAPEVLPESVRSARGLLTQAEALRLVHQPAEDADWQAARDTLRFTEALVLQAALLERRAEARTHVATPRIARDDGVLARFDEHLAFELTGDQRTVGAEIAADLSGEVPMNRLVQGEVGSGKTLVALRAMLQVADTGGQAVLLAPTEVLAAQHLRSIERVLGPEISPEVMPTLITGQMPAAAKRAALLRVAAGQARIVVGTHALLQEKVQFLDLGLVVVDEQHRFGVEQRQVLRTKAENVPHTLVLTATPIPRTVAMTVFGDLDVSVIRELPAGRAGITSHCVALAEHPAWLGRVWERVAEELALGRQAFVVCPAIDAGTLEDDADLEPEQVLVGDEGEERGEPRHLASVKETLERLRELPALSGRRIEVLHGRLASDEKDAVMRAFAAGDVDVLVATTVIEVGVDVPNASTMVVLDADRFGVSQLHQLRGRVGRGGVPGLALFVTEAEDGSVARARVEAVAGTLDGFELARVDLELRAEGDVLGTRQSGGRSGLRLLRASRDADVIEDARTVAADILESDPSLTAHLPLREAIARRLDETERAFLDKN